MIPLLADGGAARLFQPGNAIPGNGIDLGLGNPDITTLPVDALAMGMLTAAQRAAALAYGPPMGNCALVEALRRTVTRDVRHAEHALITNGAMEAVMLALRALHRPGSVLLAEQSTFPGLITAARDIGLDIVPVRTGSGGIDVDDLRARIRSLRAVGRPIAGLYLMPTAANPTGACLSAGRRRAIADLVRRYDITVIEDDAYRDVYFDGVAPEPLINLAAEQVIHIRSLSKVVCPGIRLAVVYGPRKLLDQMTALRAVGGTSPLASELLASFLDRTDYDDYLAALRGVYRVRRDARGVPAVEVPGTVLPGAEGRLLPVDTRAGEHHRQSGLSGRP